MAQLYSDEDVPYPIVERLRQLGHDVLTAFEAGQANQGIEDADQLAFATSLGRTMLTRNRKDYIRLHALTGADPVPPASRGKIDEMAEAWLGWGTGPGADSRET